MPNETQLIVERYQRRIDQGKDWRSDLVRPHRYMAHQEKERAFLRLLSRWGMDGIRKLRVLEVGCGYGANLQQFLRWGCTPHNLVGNELLEASCRVAREVLPASVQILRGDAVELDLPPNSFDIVLQSTVFTSILDNAFQEVLAKKMWSWVKPGGGVVWYDFVYDNPQNPDVRGVTRRRVRELFPEARTECRSLSLAPPIARVVARFSPRLYTLLNMCPFLRTHIFCWLEKPAAKVVPKSRAA